VRILLDTHLLLWSLLTPQRLSARERDMIEGSEVLVSAASIWEIAIKASLGRLECDPRTILDAIEPAGFEQLDVTGRHAVVAAALPPVHSDPFDRMLVAQAQVESARLLTRDAALRGYGLF
jgi:PIN domain nuclease of toxin-antitoxin system